MQTHEPAEGLILVLAPTGRDGPMCAALLQRSGLDAVVCDSMDDLLARLETGAAAVLVAEEGLFGKHLQAVAAWVGRQPAWSDLPFVVLTSHLDQPAVGAWRQKMVDALRNVSLLERPVQAITLTSAVQTACRARMRQYEVRVLLESREQAAAALESVVQARTRELEEANRELRTQMNERAQVEESLRQAQKLEALGQLTGGVAHDFNNLLMVISGGLEMLERRAEPAQRQRLIKGMRQAVERGAGLTRQLLAFSRRQPLQAEPIDLARQVAGMRDLLERSLRGDIQVSLEAPATTWVVELDPGELELAVLNLAVNARDAMPEGGRIEIRIENLPDLRERDARGSRCPTPARA